MTRRTLALAAIGAGVVAAVIAVIAGGPIVRGPGFHVYADQRELLGIAHAGDVLSNFPFVFVGLTFLPLARTWLARAACAGVVTIGLGSSIYHFLPGDGTLVLDWIPIGLTLVIVVGAVVRDRIDARAAAITLAAGAVLAVGAVLVWYAGGGTRSGGNMAPYVAVQGLGVALPAVIAAIAPGAIRARWLYAAVVMFAVARLFAAYDAELLAAVGFSGHSCKHLAAAAAAALALHAITPVTPVTPLRPADH